MTRKALINASAGSVPHAPRNDLAHVSASRSAHIYVCTDETLLQKQNSLAVDPDDLLIPWSGDGTAAAALDACAETLGGRLAANVARRDSGQPIELLLVCKPHPHEVPMNLKLAKQRASDHSAVA
jgi:hypothetical protein